MALVVLNVFLSIMNGVFVVYSFKEENEKNKRKIIFYSFACGFTVATAFAIFLMEINKI